MFARACVESHQGLNPKSHSWSVRIKSHSQNSRQCSDKMDCGARRL